MTGNACLFFHVIDIGVYVAFIMEQKKRTKLIFVRFLAEDEGFEPSRPLRTLTV